MDALVEEIDRLSRKLIRDLEGRERRLAGQLQLTASQADTLQTLEELGETAMNGLSEAMRLHGTTMTRMVDTLVDRRLVERSPDPQDRRVVRVRLTGSGCEVVAGLRRRKRDLLAVELQGMSPSDLQLLLEGLRRLAGLADRPGGDRAG